MFNEKEFEFVNGEKLEVWQTPKYLESKAKAIEMLKGNFGLTEGDFWILMNRTKGGKIAYTGLIISHNGCLKINDASTNKVNPQCFSLDKEGFNDSLVYTYQDSDTYEVGEVSVANCKNSYPYAMALKRCFDRVVLKKSRLAYTGIYSEAEADEFKEPIEEKTEPLATEKQIKYIESKLEGQIVKAYLTLMNKAEVKDLTMSEASKLISEVKK